MDADASVCREVLTCILQRTRHKIVLTRKIISEWDRNQSRFSRTWRAEMIRRGRVLAIPHEHDKLLTQRIIYHAKNPHVRHEMLRDRHLIRAARLTDRRVISKDRKIREMFSEHAPLIPELRDILWANPIVPSEQTIKWLEEGTPTQKFRCLENFVKKTKREKRDDQSNSG